MRVAIIGYGKMGRQVERTLTERGHEVALVIDVDNAADLSTEGMRGVDVAIEFTAPEAALGNIVKCLEIGVPVVCGTTAWTAHLPEVEALCKARGGAFFYASNYSIGVNVMFALNRQLARIMNRFPEYDVTVEETHHTQKKDAPSGTAITLAEDIIGGLERKTEWTGEVTTAPAELEVTSVRRSTVAGIHTVTYESPVDTLTLSHTIKERSGLALGAVLAAEFLVGKKGVYTMNDLLGF
ncbi:MAG: 4-hydroxy-tetrahydrodipicolinate reductase [Rikenellaceae bacterium]|jgi:4-hydroxy-tetrahydrodipicolinate reductase|nr:4-hydroxy-tetrahydrodipicolinate reductase [Rikenellaceae bacterium]